MNSRKCANITTSSQNVKRLKRKPAWRSHASRAAIWVLLPAPSVPEKVTIFTDFLDLAPILMRSRRFAGCAFAQRNHGSHSHTRSDDRAVAEDDRSHAALLGRRYRDSSRL